ncbi:MAG TPA: hypothetical protein VG897_01205, partial [Terriglobales bacterium]|nr:hypothetical protein [Terriglobales bacterium]
EGESVGSFGSADLNLPTAISAVGEDVYVLDTGLRRVHIFTASGRLRGHLKFEGVPFPSAFAFDAGRKLSFVGNPGLGVIQGFDQKENNVATFGSLGDAADQIRKIDSLYVDSASRVYVVDSHNAKILIFGK